MARPKEKTGYTPHASVEKSVAFENKARQEMEKLRVKVAKALEDDLLSLFEQGDHSDVIIMSGGKGVKGHRCILQARSRHIWQDEWITMETDGQGILGQHIRLTGLSDKQIQDFFRQLYIVSDSTLLLEEFLPSFPKYKSQGFKSDSCVTSCELSGERDESCHASESYNLVGESVVEVSKSTTTTTIASCELSKKPENNFEITSLTDHDDARVSLRDDCGENGTDEGKVCDRGLLAESSENPIPREKPVDCDDSVVPISDCHKNIPSLSSDVNNVTAKDDDDNEGCESKVVNNSLTRGDVDSVSLSETTGEQNELSDQKDLLILSHDEECHGILDNKNRGMISDSNSNQAGLNGEENQFGGLKRGGDDGESRILMNGRMVDVVKDGLKCEEIDIVVAGHVESVLGRDERACSGKEEEEGVKVKALASCSKSDFAEEGPATPNHESFVSRDDDNNSLPGRVSSASNLTNQNRVEDADVCQGVVSDHQGKEIITKMVDLENDMTTHTVDSELSEAIRNSYALSIPYDTCSSLGRDLLQMYLQQINCDICLSVDGVKFLGHKCVLAARSSYFSAMLGGRWCESEMEEIELQGVSAQAVEQLLLFLYGGVTELCTPSDLMELFIVMDMYGVDTLKHVLEFYVRKDLCHFFHKPCSTCVSTASSALNLCHSFYLEELQERCLKWSVKYFTKIWSNKSFANLPEAVHQKCAQSVLGTMTENCVLDVIIECTNLSSSLPRIKWTETILYLTTQLMDSAIEYTSSHFIEVIQSPHFLQWGKVASWKAGSLEEIFNSVIDSLPIDTACAAYQTLVDLKAAQSDLEFCDQDVLDLLDSMVKRCEKFLRTHIHQVARSKQWATVGKSLQSQILENSSYIHLDQLPNPKPRPIKRPLPASLVRPRPASATKAPIRMSSSSSTHSAQQPITADRNRATRANSNYNSSQTTSSATAAATSRQPKSKTVSASGIASTSPSTQRAMSTSGQRSTFTSVRNHLLLKKPRVTSSSSSSSLVSSSVPSSAQLTATTSTSISTSLSASSRVVSKTNRGTSIVKMSLDKTRKAVPSNVQTKPKDVRVIKNSKVDNHDKKRLLSTSAPFSRKTLPGTKTKDDNSPPSTLTLKTSGTGKKQEDLTPKSTNKGRETAMSDELNHATTSPSREPENVAEGEEEGERQDCLLKEASSVMTSGNRLSPPTTETAKPRNSIENCISTREGVASSDNDNNVVLSHLSQTPPTFPGSAVTTSNANEAVVYGINDCCESESESQLTTCTDSTVTTTYVNEASHEINDPSETKSLSQQACTGIALTTTCVNNATPETNGIDDNENNSQLKSFTCQDCAGGERKGADDNVNVYENDDAANDDEFGLVSDEDPVLSRSKHGDDSSGSAKVKTDGIIDSNREQ